jgi:hypothetical protein
LTVPLQLWVQQLRLAQTKPQFLQKLLGLVLGLQQLELVLGLQQLGLVLELEQLVLVYRQFVLVPLRLLILVSLSLLSHAKEPLHAEYLKPS